MDHSWSSFWFSNKQHYLSMYMYRFIHNHCGIVNNSSTHIIVCIYIFICISTHKYKYLYVYVCIYVYIYVYIYIYIYICLYIYVYIYIYVCVSICLFVCFIYWYIYIHGKTVSWSLNDFSRFFKKSDSQSCVRLAHVTEYFFFNCTYEYHVGLVHLSLVSFERNVRLRAVGS